MPYIISNHPHGNPVWYLLLFCFSWWGKGGSGKFNNVFRLHNHPITELGFHPDANFKVLSTKPWDDHFPLTCDYGHDAKLTSLSSKHAWQSFIDNTHPHLSDQSVSPSRPWVPQEEGHCLLCPPLYPQLQTQCLPRIDIFNKYLLEK